MNAGVLSTLAALVGAVIGGFMSLLASLLANRQQFRSQCFTHDRARREELYKEFIEEAAKCYVDALLQEKPNVPSVVTLYAKMSRMRVLSSHEVIESAEQLIKQIIGAYSAPARTFSEVQAEYESLDIIRNFSEKCRAEFDGMRAKEF